MLSKCTCWIQNVNISVAIRMRLGKNLLSFKKNNFFNFYSFLKTFISYWTIVDLKCCICFKGFLKLTKLTKNTERSHIPSTQFPPVITSKMILFHIYICLFFFKFFSHLGYLQNIEHSSLCYTVGPYLLIRKYTNVCIYQSQTPNLSLPSPLW